MSRRPVQFECKGEWLSGLLDEAPGATTGVLIITGGPQYRVGSHRQFAELGMALAQAGYTCMRFDHRGSGDSSGATQPFDRLDDDIRAAIDAMLAASPSLGRIVLIGLCDAAAAALIYAHTDTRVARLVLFNPWVRREQTEAQAQLDHYYPSKLTSKDFWLRVLTGKVNVLRSAASLLGNLWRARARAAGDGGDFVDRMLAGANAFGGRSLLILSGQDLTAREFSQVLASPQWLGWSQCDRVTRIDMADANHTFSRAEWKQGVIAHTLAWLGQPD